MQSYIHFIVFGEDNYGYIIQDYIVWKRIFENSIYDNKISQT